MAPPGPNRRGKKHTSDGKPKSQSAASPSVHQKLSKGTEPTPLGAQPSKPSGESSAPRSTLSNEPIPKKQKLSIPPQAQLPPSKAQPQPPRSTKKKRPRLPDNVSITKRPLHHPAIPSPFASSASPKTLYITRSSPFIPTIKRVRNLLKEITRREAQSLSSKRKPLQSNGRLRAEAVEKEIAEETQKKEGGVGAEEVYLKASGRAIERALQIGVYFQGDDDCRVRVEMGSVSAIDDIEVKKDSGEGGVEGEGGDEGAKGNKGKKWKDEDIPETRIRTLSAVTVAIGLRVVRGTMLQTR